MEPDVNYFYFTLTIVILVVICGLFSMCEGAIVTANDAKIKKMADEGNKSAKKILKLTSKPSEFLATVQTGITICGFFMIALTARMFPLFTKSVAEYFSLSARLSYAIVLIATTLIASCVIIIFGKLLPMRISQYNSEALAIRLANVFCFMTAVIKPLSNVLSKITDIFISILGYKLEEQSGSVTEEEIRMLVDVGEEKGTIEHSEKDMINNIFEMDDREISEIMTHRMDVVAVENTASYDDIINIAMKTGYSRIPVYEDDIDNIVGMVYIKDLIKNQKNPDTFVLKNNMREALFVPESVCCTELLKIFKKQKKQFAVVVDEYGGTYGIITMEDILESIVGDIQDEYDNEEEEFKKSSDGSVTFDGSISIDDAERELDIELITDEDDDYDTLSAILIHELGHIPTAEENAVVVLSGVAFKIIEADDRRILKIRAEHLADREDNVEE